MYLISAIEFSSIASLIMIVLLTTNITEHKNEGNGPNANLRTYKDWAVKLKTIPFQHIDETSLFIRVRFLSDPNCSYQIIV